MSALCIFSGMLFQMFGDALFRALHIRDLSRSGSRRSQSVDTLVSGYLPEEKESGGRATGRPTGAGERDEAKLLAAGVTVGINAAAMGTAHLMERESGAMAYSALAMTIYGGMTVALTALPGVSDFLVRLASR